MHVRSVGISGLGVVIMAIALWGCGAEEPRCPRVSGLFVPLYTPMDANGDGLADTSCESLSNPLHVNFDSGEGASAINVMHRVDDDITTEVVMKGCTMRMTQVVTDKAGVPQQQIDGDALAIRSETEVAGQVTVTMFDQQGDPMCWGVYQAQFTQNNSLYGAGAQ